MHQTRTITAMAMASRCAKKRERQRFDPKSHLFLLSSSSSLFYVRESARRRNYRRTLNFTCLSLAMSPVVRYIVPAVPSNYSRSDGDIDRRGIGATCDICDWMRLLFSPAHPCEL
ncbi:hypothetical protein SLA2020_103740 [Shorea laevis]